MRAPALWLVATLAACGSADEGLHNVVTIHPMAAPLAPATTCDVTTGDVGGSARAHVELCSPLVFDTIPPSHGDHYAIWPDFKTYDTPVPWGYLVHDLEHGAVVMAYRCDAPCPALVDALSKLIAARPADPLCAGTRATRRLVLVPDPTLDVPLAAAAWGRIYRATCFDPPSLTAFIDQHYGRAPEDTCTAGIDLAAQGWCH